MTKNKIFLILIPLLILSIILCVSIHNIVKESDIPERKAVAVYDSKGKTASSFSTYKEFEKSREGDYVPLEDTVVGNNTTPDGTVKGSYFGNKNSKVYHKSSCGAAKSTKEENKVYYSTKTEYTEKGYSPCKSCKP